MAKSSTSFAPGVSGNPTGRRLGSKNTTPSVREIVNAVVTEHVDGVKEAYRKSAVNAKSVLRRTDVDLRKGYITVQRTVSDKGRRIEPVKDGEARRVKMSPDLQAALRDHLEAMALEAGVRRWTPEQRALVFPTTYGGILGHPYFLEHVWRPLLQATGLQYRKYHSTRHTYATWLLSDGADLRWVQQQMGHATIGRTADTYGHVQPERHEAAIEGLDRYMRQAATS